MPKKSAAGNDNFCGVIAIIDGTQCFDYRGFVQVLFNKRAAVSKKPVFEVLFKTYSILFGLIWVQISLNASL